MTADTSPAEDSNRFETVFKILGVALVGLSAVLAVAVVWFTVGPALAGAASPIALGTVVFTVVVAILFKKTSDIAGRTPVSER